MIKVKRERQKQMNFLSHWCHKPLCIFCKNMGRCGWLFYKEIWEDWGFCLLSKILTPAKENSKAWVWALQQYIMGINFKTYPIEVSQLWIFLFCIFHCCGFGNKYNNHFEGRMEIGEPPFYFTSHNLFIKILIYVT